MKAVVKATVTMALCGGLSLAQTTFEVTGTPVPPDLLKASYGALPKSIGAFDISICNLTELKQTVISSKVTQALSQTYPQLRPMGRQMVLSAMLHNQGRRPLSVLNTSLTAVGSAFSVLSASKYALPSNWSSAIAFASIATQQLLSGFKPVMSAEQIEKFQTEALEPSFLLSGGSCEQRTLFTVTTPPVSKPSSLSFHVR